MRIEEIGERIRQRRRKLGLTQNALAELLRVSPQAISKWERGKNAPDITLLPTLAKALGLSIDSLLGNDTRSSYIVEGTVFAARILRYREELWETDLEQLAVHLNTIHFGVTEHALRRGGMPTACSPEFQLYAFTGEKHRERALHTARDVLAHATARKQLAVGLASGGFYLGPVGHPGYARPAALGGVVTDAVQMTIWAERHTRSMLGVTREIASVPILSGKTRGPELFKTEDDYVLWVYEVQVAHRQ